MLSAYTDPGCDAESHRHEVVGALMAWEMGCRWPQPQVMDCGCRLWVGREAERKAMAG